MAKKNDYPRPIIIIDSREREPFKFRASSTCDGYEIAKLDAGDYSIKGFENLITVERKNSIIELCGNLGKNRVRFEAELERMKSIKFRYVIVEDHWASIFQYKKHTTLSGPTILGSILAFNLKYGVQFIFAGDRKQAQQITRNLLIKAYNYRMDGIV